MQSDRKRRVRVAPNLYRRPTDGKFEAGFTDAAGAWRMKTLRASTLRDAKLELAELQVKVGRGEVGASSKVTLSELIDEYLADLESKVASGERGERTLERYRQHLDRHVRPLLGRTHVQRLTPDHLARLIRDKRLSGLAPWTIKGMLTPLGRVLALGVRRGLISESPLRRLDSTELPKGAALSEPRVLTSDEIRSLLRHSTDAHRPFLATAVFSGLRLQELLGLRWCDVDFECGLLRVRHQLTRGSKAEAPRLVRLKTKSARRDVVLLPELGDLLREHRRLAFARGRASAEDFVFASRQGTPLNYRNVCTRGLDKAAGAAELNGDSVPKLTMHDLRHTYASHLIRQGLDPVRAARQLGHARPSITLDVYAHEFAEARDDSDVRRRLSAAFGGTSV